jgi:4-pyridoxolactonase
MVSNAAANVRAHLPDAGTLVIDGCHRYCNLRPGGPARLPCYSLLAEHELPRQATEQAISGHLKLRGADSSEITQVVNSSYHFDHVSGNKHCGYSHLECAGIGPSYELPSGGTEIAA